MSIFEYAATGVGGIVTGLFGMIYRDLTRRIAHTEKTIENIPVQLAELSVDVKYIKENCRHCGTGKGD